MIVLKTKENVRIVKKHLSSALKKWMGIRKNLEKRNRLANIGYMNEYWTSCSFCHLFRNHLFDCEICPLYKKNVCVSGESIAWATHYLADNGHFKTSLSLCNLVIKAMEESISEISVKTKISRWDVR